MHCNMCSEKNPCTDCLIQEAKIKTDQELYDSNVCLICFKQHNSKQEMIDCDCIYSNKV